jgi:hypothetical protein
VIDIRSKIQIGYVSDTTAWRGVEPKREDVILFPGSVIATNIFQSLLVVRGSSGEYCFDTHTKQLIRLPDTLDTYQIAPTETDGSYLLMTRGKIYSFDRF